MSKLRRTDRTNPSLLHIMAIAAIAAILTLPTILHGFPAGGHDSLTHLTWYTQFSEQLWAGNLYPRWLPGDNAGLGAPVFFFYGSAPYFIGSIFRPFFTSDQHSWYQLGSSAVLALAASGIAVYLWIRSITRPNSAILAAAFYMIMPYHVAIDLYERGALSEFWAFVWMPLCLFCVSEIRKGRRSAMLGLAVSYALLVMTHLPTTLIFSLIPVAYSAIGADGNLSRKSVWTTMAAMALGVGVSAVYLLPAMSMQDYVNVNRDYIQTLYANSYLFTEIVPDTTFRIELTLVVIGMIAISTCAIVIGSSNLTRFLKKERNFWIIVGTISIFMMSPLSKPIVRVIPVLHRIQFPWRYNAILVIATVALLSLGWEALKRPYSARAIGALVLSASLLLGWTFVTIWQGIQESTPPYYFRAITATTKEPLNEIIERGSFDINYRPIWVQSDINQSAAQTPRVSIDKGIAEWQIKTWEPRNILLSVDSSTESSLIVGQFYFPGWVARVVGEPCCLPLQPSQPDGLLAIELPPGSYELNLRLTVGTTEQIGRAISVVSLLIVLLMMARIGSMRRAPQPMKESQ